MYGFPLLRALSIITLEDLCTSYFCKEPDLTDAKLLDVHSYIVNDIQYTQKVYRLKDSSLYTKTTQDSDVSIKFLQEKLDESVKAQNFEVAAYLRDKIKSLK
jgi:excinuclease UvrABC helicase subunit UvrB